MEEADTGADVVGLGIVAGDGEGVGGDVESGDVGLREVMGDGDSDGSGAGAYVEDAEGFRGGQAGQNGFHEEFSLRAGYEDCGGDVKRKTVELLCAGDVLDGLVVEAACNRGLIGDLLIGGQAAVGIGKELAARDVEDVEEQELGVAGGGIAEMRVLGEAICGGGDGLAAGYSGGDFFGFRGLSPSLP